MTDYRGETPHTSKDKKLKPQTSAGKVMLILLWHCNGLIPVHYFEPTTTVTIATSYIHIFDSNLKTVTQTSVAFCSIITCVGILQQLPMKQSGS
jgi:hypothetical protein